MKVTSLLEICLLLESASAFTASFGPATASITTGNFVTNIASSNISRRSPAATTAKATIISSTGRRRGAFQQIIATTSSSTSLALFNQNQIPEPEPPAERYSLPSPSKINTFPEPIQASILLLIMVSLGISTIAFSSFLDSITSQYEWVQSWRYTWPLLGAIYAAAGITHFTLSEEYENIFPTKGAWGIWYLPGSPKFHVQWTGMAELLGGIGLLIGGAYDFWMPVWGECPNVLTNAGIGSDAAAALLVLTAAMTPANVFMYTHGAKLPIDGPEVPVVGHLIRGVMQVVLFGLLYQMGQGTFDDLLKA